MSERSKSEKRHPIQPLVTDENGRLRFKANAIVKFLLENAPDEDAVYLGPWSSEDREQFAQLIGYSWDGASSLSYMSDEVLDAAKEMRDAGTGEHEARTNALRKQLNDARNGMREGVADLFGVHPDDLEGDFDE